MLEDEAWGRISKVLEDLFTPDAHAEVSFIHVKLGQLFTPLPGIW